VRAVQRFRRLYGAAPAHLAGFALSAAAAGYAIREFLHSDAPARLFIWFFGAIVVHDLVFLPAYSLIDRVLSRRPAAGLGPARYARARVHIRVPTMLAGLLALVFFPLISRTDRSDYGDASGLTPDAYLHRWLWVAGGLYALSAVIYVFRVVHSRRGNPGR